MADTIYFPDGSMEVLIGPHAFENLILTRLGTDAFNWYIQAQEEKQSEEEDNYEEDAEFYRDLCLDAIDSIDQVILTIEQSKRLNRDKILSLLRSTREHLHENL